MRRFPQTRRKQRSPTQWFVDEAAVFLAKRTLHAPREAIRVSRPSRGARGVRLPVSDRHAARRRGFFSSASTTRSIAITRDPLTNTTSPGIAAAGT